MMANAIERLTQPAPAQLQPVAPKQPSRLQRGANPYPAAAEISVKGNGYLQVADRLAWVRRDYPCAEIETVVHSATATGAVIQCRIRLINNDGLLEGVGAGIGTCKAEDFGDYVEKAETRAIGRALGSLGYGTAEHDDGGRLADSPRPRPQQQNGGRRG